MKTWQHSPRGFLADVLVIGLLLGQFGVPHALAESEPLTKEQGDAILEELKSIRRLLETMQVRGSGRARGPAPPTRVSVALGDGHVLGRDDAPLTLVEFTDYQCPYCRRFFQQTFPALKREYIDTGKVRFVSRDLPLAMHQHARDAARAARCAGEQGQFWELRVALFANAPRLALEAIIGYAKELPMDQDQFQSCLGSDEYEEEIERDIAEARAIGATGTPTFVLGKTAPDRIEGLRFVGALPYPAFRERLESLLPAR